MPFWVLLCGRLKHSTLCASKFHLCGMDLFSFASYLGVSFQELNNWMLTNIFGALSGLIPRTCNMSIKCCPIERQYNLLTLALIFILWQSLTELPVLVFHPVFSTDRPCTNILISAPKFEDLCHLLYFGSWKYLSVLVTPVTSRKLWICSGFEETCVLSIASLLWILAALQSYSCFGQMKLVSEDQIDFFLHDND